MKKWFLLLFAFLLAACAAPTPVEKSLPTPIVEILLTATPAPTRTATVTLPPSPTIELSPTPTLHPLTINAMRAGDYPGSDLVIEKELTETYAYRRYIASYYSEGLKQYGLLTVPKGEKPASGWPVIIFNHGYIPPTVYRTTERYVAYVDFLARSGYIIFRPDYRGHDQSEGEARGAYGYPDYVVDVLNAVSTLKKYPDADPNRIGMWGHSMGGYITLRIMVIRKDIKAGVIWAGVVASYPDMLTKWRRVGPSGNTPTPLPAGWSSWRTSLLATYGDFETNPEFWDSVSAVAYLNDISGPLQLHHGTDDADVPLEFSEDLFFRMLKADQYVELYKYEGDNHNISNSFTQAMQRSLDFFDKYVK